MNDVTFLGTLRVCQMDRQCRTELHVTVCRGSRSVQNLVATYQRYSWPVLTSKEGCKGSNGENWLFNPGTSSGSERYSSKWLIWPVCREPLVCYLLHSHWRHFKLALFCITKDGLMPHLSFMATVVLILNLPSGSNKKNTHTHSHAPLHQISSSCLIKTYTMA